MTEYEIDTLIADLKSVEHDLANGKQITVSVPQTQPTAHVHGNHGNQMMPYTTSQPHPSTYNVNTVHNAPVMYAPPTAPTTWTISLGGVDYRSVEALRKTIKLLEHMKVGLRFIDVPG